MTVTIFHNPACSASRRALATIREAGVEPEIVLYLKTPPDRARLEGLIAAIGLPVREIMRAREPAYAALGLGDPAVTDAQLVDAILAHPVLLNRPIVETPRGTRLCRPAEVALDLLDPPATDDRETPR
ncbi:MAG: arsenate reductase (glutaredoxin) [Pseudomonadota bacterium]|nr:arsenate reductase (glutaredoxin) [Pseudomonadota bacterium]MEE3102106.1 arsenate reductase (glutaredoxin) [Pseudomonadota bacterium]